MPELKVAGDLREVERSAAARKLELRVLDDAAVWVDGRLARTRDGAWIVEPARLGGDVVLHVRALAATDRWRAAFWSKVGVGALLVFAVLNGYWFLKVWPTLLHPICYVAQVVNLRSHYDRQGEHRSWHYYVDATLMGFCEPRDETPTRVGEQLTIELHQPEWARLHVGDRMPVAVTRNPGPTPMLGREPGFAPLTALFGALLLIGAAGGTVVSYRETRPWYEREKYGVDERLD